MRPRTAPVRETVRPVKYIYAYLHVRTNQVLYSLERALRPSKVLEQLPDTGANDAKATGSIRRDHWRPFFVVSFPLSAPRSLPDHDPNFDNDRISRFKHTYKRLRELRQLHEYNWTPPASLSQRYTEEEIEKLKKRLEDRGGSKKETVFDLIKREKKKVRRAEVWDQKANSVADLAAVLLEKYESPKIKVKQSFAASKRMKMIAIGLAARSGAVERLKEAGASEKDIAEMQASALDVEKDLARFGLDELESQLRNDVEMADTPEARSESRGILRGARTAIKEILSSGVLGFKTVQAWVAGDAAHMRRLTSLARSQERFNRKYEATDGAGEGLTTQAPSARPTALAEAGTQTQQDKESDEARSAEHSTVSTAPPMQPPSPGQTMLTALQRGGQLVLESVDLSEGNKQRPCSAHAPLPRENVTVKFYNELDAEFAEAWPHDVTIESMGVNGRSMPHTEDGPSKRRDAQRQRVLGKLQQEVLKAVRDRVAESRNKGSGVVAKTRPAAVDATTTAVLIEPKAQPESRV